MASSPESAPTDQENPSLRRCCLADRQRTVSGQSQSIGERFEQERAQENRALLRAGAERRAAH